MRDQVIAILEQHIDLGSYRFSGDSNIKVKCPFHKGGQETKPSFSINVDLGLFQCFTCHQSGTVKKLLALLGLSSSQVDTETRELKALFDANRFALAHKRRTDCVGIDPFKAPYVLPETIVAAYDLMPLSLVNGGFDPQILKYLEVGFDRHNHRITYPIRDLYGNLAGIVGGKALESQEPKYMVYEGKRQDRITGRKIPSHFGFWFDEDRQYDGYEFKNHEYIWGYDKFYPRLFFGKEVQTLVLVEGYKAAAWVLQCGFVNVGALMGSKMSYRQKQLILRLRGNDIVLFLDNNEAGWDGTEKIGSELHKLMPGVRIVRYPDDAHEGCQPDDLVPEAVSSAIANAVTYSNWIAQRRAQHVSK
jgi:hypothetical protein